MLAGSRYGCGAAAVRRIRGGYCTEIRDALDGGQVSSVQLVQQYLDRIQAYDKQGPKLDSIVRVNPEGAGAGAGARCGARANGFARATARRAHRS